MKTLPLKNTRQRHFAIQQRYVLPHARIDCFGTETLKIAQRGFSPDGSIFNLTPNLMPTLMPTLIPNLIPTAPNHASKSQPLAVAMSQLQPSAAPLGLVILNTEGQVQWMTPKALQWLETYFTKSASSVYLPDRLWSWVQHQVQGITCNCDRAPACLPLSLEQGSHKLVIRLVIEPTGDRYLLLLEEQARSGLSSLKVLGLSDRETEVLACLMQGQDNKAMAAQLSVHVGTIRKHLENIYQKFGVKSRSEAIAHALKQLGFGHHSPT
jgi:DNA-binding CsgD family transcriptional regulator